MIDLAARVPVQLTPQQTVLVAALAAGLALAIVVGALFESTASGLIALLLRLAGHRPPRKSAMRRRLDELEERLRDR